MSFASRTDRNRWRFLRNRSPYNTARHGERGENRTNNLTSKTRRGSDAVCRYIKFASPEICYANFYYLEVSEHGEAADLYEAVRHAGVLPFIFAPTFGRGFRLNRLKEEKGGSMNRNTNLDAMEREALKAELYERLYAVLEDRTQNDNKNAAKNTERTR